MLFPSCSAVTKAAPAVNLKAFQNEQPEFYRYRLKIGGLSAVNDKISRRRKSRQLGD